MFTLCETLKSEILFFKTTETIDACGYTPYNFHFVTRVLDIEYLIAALPYMFSLQLLRHLVLVFYVMLAVKMFNLIELLHLARRSYCKQRIFSTCDWLLFLFTIITLRSLLTKLRLSYDEVTTNLRRICDDFMINLWLFEIGPLDFGLPGWWVDSSMS